MDFKKCVVYQIYPKSFMDSNADGIGDIQGIISKLDYIKYLGADIIWLCPIYKSPMKDNGYDISDYYDIDPIFGTLDDFKELLDKAHKKDIKIMMDLVVNHTSDQHPWFLESKSSLDNNKRDYYIWRDPVDGKQPSDQLGYFMESVWEYDDTTKQYYFHNFTKEQPELNWENEELRHEIYKMMNFWLDLGIDGFRMDTINLISKPDECINSKGGKGKTCQNGPKVHDYIKEMNKYTFSKYDTVTVGETPGASVEDAKKYAGFNSDELNMVFQFELVSAANQAFVDKWCTDKLKLKDFKKITEKWQKGLYNCAWNSLYLSNHDQPRQVSRYGNTSNKHFWEKSAKMLATIMHMQQGTPYIYQGEEIGMKNYQINSLEDCKDCEIFTSYDRLLNQEKFLTHDAMMEAINEKSRDHSRTPMQWNNQKNAGFSLVNPWIAANPSYTEINVDAQMQDSNSILNYYRKLIDLRHNYDVITYGDFNLIFADNDSLFAYTREYKNTKLYVIANYTKSEINLPIKLNLPVLISNYDDLSDSLRPYEVKVYIQERE